MRRKLLLGGTALLVLGLTFGLTSLAFGSARRVRLQSNLAVNALSPTQLSDATKLALNNSIGDLASDFGITTSSYDQVRVLDSTTLGLLYLVPGSGGACLVLDGGASCGDPGSADDSHVLALFSSTNSGYPIVGGGIVDTQTPQVTVTGADGVPHVFSANSYGIFTVEASDGILRDPEAVLGITP